MISDSTPTRSALPVLTLERLREACRRDAAIRRVARLQPAGGPGDKVFPPTYEGGEYALEDRVINGQKEPCALLDSVQSQANRIEMALLEAYRADRIRIPVVSVDFANSGLPELGVITSLEAPHRLADAILRDASYNGKRFLQSYLGEMLDTASYANATGLFGACPTALLLGLWDSTSLQARQGVKFARALVSEVFAVGAVTGKRPSSRIDPLQIVSSAGPVYRTDDGDWTLNGKAPKVKGGEKTPAEINHGNVVPTLRTKKGSAKPKGRGASEGYGTEAPKDGKEGYQHGGITCRFAQQITVLSMPALRRLGFPDGAGKRSVERDEAARVVLAALGLCGVALSVDQGADLRSRCLLVPDAAEPPRLEIVTASGGTEPVQLDVETALALFKTALEDATKKHHLPWTTDEIMLTPKPELIELVKGSRGKAAESNEEAD